MKSFGVLIGLAFCLAHSALAQHPVDVQRKSAEGAHYEALLAYEKLPQRILDTTTTIAAAKSAWALGLGDRAAELYDTALRDKSLSDELRTRITLERAILEYQEGRYQVAELYSEKAMQGYQDVGPLRARILYVWAEALAKRGQYGSAEQKYESALNEADIDLLPSLHFELASCKYRLGKLEEAKSHFESVPLNHDEAPAALRQLAEIALASGNFPKASFWLNKGKAEYPQNFLDSWVDYALYQAANSSGDYELANSLREDAKRKYPASDPWVILLDGEAEASHWLGRASMRSEK